MKSPGILSIFAFIMIGGLLTACVPPLSPYLSIDKVRIIGKELYLHGNVSYLYEQGQIDIVRDKYFQSNDQGMTWKEISKNRVIIIESFADPTWNPNPICVDDASRVCFRISSEPMIEVSEDGGKNWQIDWQIPSGRLEFMERNPKLKYLNQVKPDNIPADLAVFRIGAKSVVIVPMGNQGILLKTLDGFWKRIAVKSSDNTIKLGEPFPFYAIKIDESIAALFPEICWTIFFSFLILVIFSFWGWKKLRNLQKEEIQRQLIITPLFFWLSMAGILLLSMYTILNFGAMLENELVQAILSFDYFFGFYLLPLAGLLISWAYQIAVMSEKKEGMIVIFSIMGMALCFAISILIPFVMWTFGVIASHSIGMVIGIFLGMFVIFSGIRIINRITSNHIPSKIATPGG